MEVCLNNNLMQKMVQLQSKQEKLKSQADKVNIDMKDKQKIQEKVNMKEEVNTAKEFLSFEKQPVFECQPNKLKFSRIKNNQ